MQALDRDRIDQESTIAVSSDDRFFRCTFCTLDDEADQLENRPWLQTDSYSALVSKGALVPGWSLVCPKEHLLNLSGHYGREAFWHFVDRTATRIRKVFGKACYFEHGANKEGSSTGCGTDHAHLHVVPFAGSIVKAARFFDPSFSWEPCLAHEIASRAQGREYLFMFDEAHGFGTVGQLTLLDQPLSQFFRRVLACELGMSTVFDYKQYPMKDIVLESLKKLGSDK